MIDLALSALRKTGMKTQKLQEESIISKTKELQYRKFHLQAPQFGRLQEEAEDYNNCNREVFGAAVERFIPGWILELLGRGGRILN